MNQDLHDLHDGGDWITLRRGLFEELMALPEGALKIYIYLRSLDSGQCFSAAIPTIKRAVGCETRCANRSLKLLRKKKLIQCKGGENGRPYLYSFPFPASKVGPAPESTKVAPAVPSCIDGSEAPVQMVPTTPAAAVMDLNSVRRRPVDDVIKILKTMISVAAAVKQRQMVRQSAEESEAAGPLEAKPLEPTGPKAVQEATLGELIAESRGGSANAFFIPVPGCLV